MLSIGRVFGLLELDDQFTAKLRTAAEHMGQFSSKLEKVGNQTSQLGDRMTMSLSLPLAAIGGGAMKAAIDFESSFAGVRKTVDATSEQFAKMEVDIRNMAKAMPLSVNDINKVAEAAGALGVRREDILGFTETMVKLGATTNLTADEAATSMARFTNIMKIPTSEVGNLGAALVDLGNKGASTEREIMDMSLRLAGAGKTVGMTAPQVLGMANALSSLGIEAEMGGSAMSKAMVNMAAAVSQGGEKLDQIARIALPGVTDASAKFAETFRKDAGQAISMFVEGLSRVQTSGGDLLGVLSDLDINETRLRDTMLRVANAGNLVSESMRTGAAAFEEGSALQTEYDERLNTTAARLELFKNRIYDAGITLGETLVPAAERMFNAAEPLIGLIESLIVGFSNLPEPVQTFAFGLGAIAVAAGPVLSWGGRLISMFGAIGTAVGFGGAAGAGGAGVGASGAIVGFSTILAGLAVPAALAGIAYGFVKIADAIKAASRAFQEGRFWEHIFTREETWLSRATGVFTESRTGQTTRRGRDVNLPTPTPAPSNVVENPRLPAAISTRSGGGFAAEMRQAQTDIKGMSVTTSELARAIQSGAYSFEQLKEKSGLSEMALRMFQDRVEKASSSQKKHTEELEKNRRKFEDLMNDYNAMQREALHAPLSRLPGMEQDISMPTGGFADAHWVEWAAMQRESRDRALIDQFRGQLPGKMFEIQMPPIPPTFWQNSFGSSTNFGGGLASAIMGALQGGGDIFGSIGSFVGQGLTTGLAKHLTGGLTPMLTGVLGGAVNAVLPGLGALLGPITSKIFSAFSGIFDRNKGRDIVEEFAESMGGFDEPGGLHDQLLELGDAGEQLWIRLTQGVGRNNPKEAKAAIEAITEALRKHAEEQSKIQDEINATEDATADVTEGMIASRDVALEFGRATPEAMEKLITVLDKMVATMEDFIDRISGAGDELGALSRKKVDPIRIPYYYEQEGGSPPSGVIEAGAHERDKVVTVNFNGRQLARETVPYIADELQLQGV